MLIVQSPSIYFCIGGGKSSFCPGKKNRRMRPRGLCPISHSSENPWLKGSLVSSKEKELLLPLLQNLALQDVHIGSTLGAMQKTIFLSVAAFLKALCSWELWTSCPHPPSLKFTHQQRTRDYWTLFYQEKKGRIHCDNMTSKLQATVTTFSSSPRKL